MTDSGAIVTDPAVSSGVQLRVGLIGVGSV